MKERQAIWKGNRRHVSVTVEKNRKVLRQISFRKKERENQVAYIHVFHELHVIFRSFISSSRWGLFTNRISNEKVSTMFAIQYDFSNLLTLTTCICCPNEWNWLINEVWLGLSAFGVRLSQQFVQRMHPISFSFQWWTKTIFCGLSWRDIALFWQWCWPQKRQWGISRMKKKAKRGRESGEIDRESAIRA